MTNKNSPLSMWLAPVIGPVVGAVLAVSAAGRGGGIGVSPVSLAVGGAISGFVAGLVLMFVDWRRRSRETSAPIILPQTAGTTSPPQSGVVRLGMIVFTAIVLISGIAVVVVGAGNIKQGRASSAWRSVGGQMVSVEATEQTGGRRSYAPQFIVLCRYRYVVNDIEYTGTRWRFASNTVSERQAKEFAENHRSGMEVTVYFDPADPAESTLETGAARSQYVGAALFGPAMILGSVIGLYYLTVKSRYVAR